MKKFLKYSVLLMLSLVVLMGQASAIVYDLVITDPASTELSPGDLTGIAYQVDFDTAGNPVNVINVTVDTGTANDLQFSIMEPGQSQTVWSTAGIDYTMVDPYAAGITLYVRAIAEPTDAVGSMYVFVVDGEGTYSTGAAAYASATTTSTLIPEFPTIALPIAAIIGLAFFMQRRKNE